MPRTPLKRDARYTYADYLGWSDDGRWELIRGVAYNMTPAPSRRHQAVSRELLRQFANHLFGKRCEVFDAPFDVRLPAPGESEETTSTVASSHKLPRWKANTPDCRTSSSILAAKGMKSLSPVRI